MAEDARVQHVTLFSEKDKFAGWPANHGIWSWGDEILVGFVVADHLDKERGHTYDPATARLTFARSLDGGTTWALADAYACGIRGTGHDNHGSDATEPARACPGGIDFTHPGFALTFSRMNNHNGPSNFYYSHDRGHTWEGPFAFPDLDTAGFANRTDYIVEGKHQLLAFVTAAKQNGLEGRVACARTTDGGRTWERVAWIGEEPQGEKGCFEIMPASARLGAGRYLVVTRCRDLARAWLNAYISDDHAATWRRLDEPASDLGRGNPPALVRLQDGRLCLAYGVRIDPSRMCVRLSSDEGSSWSEQVVVRGGDGANFDMGYPRMVQRTDGKVLLVYYYNNALTGGPPFRHIAGTIFDPNAL